MAAPSDIDKMIFVGLVWGATNALMRKGALIFDTKSKTPTPHHSNSPSHPLHRIFLSLRNYITLIQTWQFSVPLLVNLSASAAFFAILGRAPISVAVPVTNATTFAATAVVGVVLGEEVRVGFAGLGVGVIVLGVWLCVM